MRLYPAVTNGDTGMFKLCPRCGLSLVDIDARDCQFCRTKSDEQVHAAIFDSMIKGNPRQAVLPF